MTAVNINALGSVSLVNQPVQSPAAKESSVKGDFEKVMKDRTSQRGSMVQTSSQDAVKKPVQKPDYDGGRSRKAKELLEKSKAKDVRKKTDLHGTANELAEGVAEILGMTPEELKAALDSLGMNIGDLADRNNVAQLILQLNGQDDISSMLVDNGMLEAFNELNDFVAKTLEANNASEDAFRDFMDGMEAGLAGTSQMNPDENTVFEEDGESSQNGTLASTRSEEILKTDFSEAQTIAAETFMKNLEMAAEEVGNVSEAQTDIREIVSQVVERIKVQLNPDSTSLEMRLNPENLGRVSINITSKEGVMTAEIRTENRQAKEAIESQLQLFKENIEAKGIKVEAIEVRISDFNMADDRNSQAGSDDGTAGKGHGTGRRDGFYNDAEAGTEESNEEEILNPGSTVSYRA